MKHIQLSELIFYWKFASRNSQHEPSVFSMLKGREVKTVLLFRRIPLEQVPDDEKEAGAWLHKLFQEKVIDSIIHQSHDFLKIVFMYNVFSHILGQGARQLRQIWRIYPRKRQKSRGIRFLQKFHHFRNPSKTVYLAQFVLLVGSRANSAGVLSLPNCYVG